MDRVDTFRCLHQVAADARVEFGGTGVMCWHTSTFRADLSQFERRNMADIWVGIQAFQKQVPIMVIAHSHGYLQYSLPGDKWTIWKQESENIEAAMYQAEVINRTMR
jgi:hypothetical protein